MTLNLSEHRADEERPELDAMNVLVDRTQPEPTRAVQLELIDDSLCDLVMEAHRYATDPVKREALKKNLARIIDKLRAWREEPQPAVDRDELARRLAGAGGYNEDSWGFLKRPGSIADHHLVSEAYRRADIAIAALTGTADLTRSPVNVEESSGGTHD